MKKVSADTITELTLANALPANEPAGTPPTIEQLIRQIRAEQKKKISNLAKLIQESGIAAEQKSAFTLSHDRTITGLQEFEKLVAAPPNGFRLAPVLYSRVEPREAEAAYSQFRSGVRHDFMRFLAKEHAAELLALGIAPQGIERMKTGRSPVNAAGRAYEADVDHIIERMGGGLATTTTAIDPQRPAGSSPSYLVNHFSNLLLLPQYIHEMKNALNRLQTTNKIPQGQGKWMLMLVPVTGPGHAGYVAQPQDEPFDVRQPVDRLKVLKTAASATHKVNALLEDPAQNPELLPLALSDLAHKLTSAFNASAKPQLPLKKAFVHFYQSEDFKALRENVKTLPAAEAEPLTSAIKLIDDGIDSRFNEIAAKMPANNNRPKTAKQLKAQQRAQRKPVKQRQSRKQKKRSHSR